MTPTAGVENRGMKATQERCYRLVRARIAPGGSVLEVSCGDGAILGALKKDGYRVCGTNYTRYPELPEGVEERAGVDILRGLPFADGSFDAVILCDVIEHLSDHDAAVRELARVTRADGVVVVLTPNSGKIGSRLNFLLTGFVKVKRVFIGFDVPPEKSFAFHNYPVYLPVYLYQAHCHGLALERIEAVGVKPKSVLMWLALGPWIRLCTWFYVLHAQRNLRGRESGRRLLGAMTCFAALCGESLVACHRKRVAAAVDEGRATALPEWHRRA